MVRIKYRYLLFSVLYPEQKPMSRPSPEELTCSHFASLLRDQIAFNFGSWGSGSVAASLIVKYFSQATSTGILRVGRQYLRIAWAALTFMNNILGQPVVVNVVHVSGTIKKAMQEAVHRDKLALFHDRQIAG